ncbi:hypothetical protein Q7C36_007427 [Tachysurus vachellii]|uniref:SET domain-containing protein n=1 Tax=Tachysurus vachellii TaxID=175792 RepID=A0AA88SZH9_TACVA|nr:hypothetical protein Q7C36_007427 [Tachysurus vachellii]
MTENVRSLSDRREPLGMDRDRGGEVSKQPPARGRGCSRKRKGTPVKVCDRVFATEDDEENTLEHNYGPGNGQGRAEHKHRSSPYRNSESTQTCPAEAGEQSSIGGRGAVLYPPPNCRIREVHCGNQVRLVVVAIRDITKGEEITVDYNPSEWGENTMTRGSSAAASEPSPDHEKNIKKEEESGSGPVSDYVTPSWSLSPKSSQLSHSEVSDSDEAEPRSRTPRRRKKNRKISSSAAANTNVNTNDKRKPPHPPPHRPPGRPPSQPLPHSLPSCPTQPPAPSRPVFKCPAPAGVGGSTVNASAGRGVSPAMQKQCCVYCGRHYRSLQHHLDKHHTHQQDVRAAMLKSQGSAHLPHFHASLPSSSSSSSSASGHNHNHREAIVIPTQQSPPPPPPSVSPARKSPALTSPSLRKSPATPPPTTPPRRGGGVPVSVLKRSPPTPVTLPRKVGRKKKEKEELDLMEKMKEEFVEPSKHVEDPKLEEEENEEEGEEDDDSGAEDKSDLSSSRRPHMLPLLSSLSSLVLYLRRLQHSAFISLSRSPQSAEAWRLLCHSSLALLILYNRRRECEVSKLTIPEYQARITPQCSAPLPTSALTPLEASLSPFERLVLPHLPRVGVQGKRGRVQPLILPPHSEHCLELLLQTRAGVGVDPQNPYVFARPYHSPATPLRGTDLLRNLAKSSGTRHPRALTQTRVRRQVAILTQLLMLSEGEEENQHGAAQLRLENFLQKEYHVTQSCASIGQDPGLMGLIGRVVLCGERDGVLFRGMSLHHICLELDVMSGNSADSLSEESDGEQEKDKSESSAIMIKKSSSGTKTPRLKKMSPFSPNRKRSSGQVKTGKRGVLKRPWSEAERAAVESHLVRNIMELRVPAKADCERCLEQCPLLVTNRRDWRAIKFYCHNRIQLLKKTQQRQSPPALSVC